MPKKVTGLQLQNQISGYDSSKDKQVGSGVDTEGVKNVKNQMQRVKFVYWREVWIVNL